MNIRPYAPEDDAALMNIEYRSPRGVASPFVHYRRRFADRAAMFPDAQLFVLEVEGTVMGCIAIAFKLVQVSGAFYPFGYMFDLRVAPELRRGGYGTYLTQFLEDYARSRGALAVYGDVVTTNLASMALLEKLGYRHIRQLLYLDYQPIPACAPAAEIIFDQEDDQVRFSPLIDRDFYVEEVTTSVTPFGYARFVHDSDHGFASLSAFDISQIYRQVTVDDLVLPAAQLEQQSRTLRLFHAQGTVDAPDLLQDVFEMARYTAMEHGFYSLSLVVDAEETLPFYFFEQAEKQKRYWLVFKALDAEFDPEWNSPFYIDAREI
jgi:ribosomal protein S18 acetylase RimI-like enzyme